jgi:tRNA modification GTPase
MAAGGAGWAVNLRQAEALTRAQAAFVDVQNSIAEGLPLDFWTIDLREAACALGEVTGDEVAEEVLDTVFSKFCIGK